MRIVRVGRLRLSRRTISLLAVSLAAAAAMAAPASAGNGVETKVTIHYDGFHAPHGKVYSPRAVCRHHRKVYLIGKSPQGGGVLDFTFTNNHGKWRLNTQQQGATGLRAKAARKHANGVNCAPDRSPVVPTGLGHR